MSTVPRKSKRLLVTLKPKTQCALSKLERKFNLSASAIINTLIWRKADELGLVDSDHPENVTDWV